MTSPLYRGAAEAAAAAFTHRTGPGGPVWGGNAGLWYDKFCDRWADDFSGLETEDAKRQWIETVIHPRGRDGRPDPTRPPVKVGDAALLAEQARRRRAMVERQGGLVLDLTLTARFVTGLGRRHPVENGFAWHHTLGVPFLAGSGVKGMLRAWAQQTAPDRVDAMFGPGPGQNLHVGAVIVLDAVPTAPLALAVEVTTPHTGGWNLADPDSRTPLDPPADWHSPTPIPYLVTEAGAAFQFALMGRNGDAPPEDLAIWLTDALDWLGAGAKTANGMGRFATADQTPQDPTFTFPATPAHPGARPAARPAATASPPRRATVDGEPVEILKREGSRYVVRFVGSGDIETVDEDEIE